MKLHLLILTATLISGCAIPRSPSCCGCSHNNGQPSDCCDQAMPQEIVQMPTAEQTVLPPVAEQWDPVEMEADNQRLQALENDLRQLEIQRKYERAHQRQLEDSVQSMSGQLARLNTDVVHWRNEVVRLEDEALAQQTRDLQSLEKIGQLVQQLPEVNSGD